MDNYLLLLGIKSITFVSYIVFLIFNYLKVQ